MIEGDFLQHQTEERYGLIVMNPPFSLKGNTRFYADHIAHAHTMLNQGGTLAAITPPSLLGSLDKKNGALCDLISMNCGEVWRNGAGAFKDAGTAIDTVTLVFTDEGPDWMDAPIEGHPSNGVMQVSLAVETDGELYSARAAIVKKMAETETVEKMDELRTSVRALYQGLLSNMRSEGQIVYVINPEDGHPGSKTCGICTTWKIRHSRLPMDSLSIRINTPPISRGSCAHIPIRQGWRARYGEEFAEMFGREESVLFENVRDDGTFCDSPCAILPTDGLFNHGMGGMFPHGEEAAALADYKRTVREMYKPKIEHAREMKQMALNGLQSGNRTIPYCDNEIAIAQEAIEKADEKDEVSKHRA